MIQDARVAQGAADRIVPREAIAAMDLQRVGGRAHTLPQVRAQERQRNVTDSIGFSKARFSARLAVHSRFRR
jgi:hypothetical protein